MRCAAQDLCEGFPAEFLTFLEYTRTLEFDQKPDYDFLRGLFRDLADSRGQRPQTAHHHNRPDRLLHACTIRNWN